MATRKNTPARFKVQREDIKLMKTAPPIPEEALPDGGKSIYPVQTMGEGEAFEFPFVASLKSAMRRSVTTSVLNETKRNPHKQFVTRIIEDEGVIRCWRITDKAMTDLKPESPSIGQYGNAAETVNSSALA